MKQLLALVLLAGCGDRVWINLVDASAAREPNDHVVVTATVECEAVGLGRSDCSEAKEYCVSARWLGSAGDTLDTGSACKQDVLASRASTTLVVRSTKPIPRGAQIALAITSAKGGRSLAEPISSP